MTKRYEIDSLVTWRCDAWRPPPEGFDVDTEWVEYTTCKTPTETRICKISLIIKLQGHPRFWVGSPSDSVDSRDPRGTSEQLRGNLRTGLRVFGARPTYVHFQIPSDCRSDLPTMRRCLGDNTERKKANRPVAKIEALWIQENAKGKKQYFGIRNARRATGTAAKPKIEDILEFAFFDELWVKQRQLRQPIVWPGMKVDEETMKRLEKERAERVRNEQRCKTKRRSDDGTSAGDGKEVPEDDFGLCPEDE